MLLYMIRILFVLSVFAIAISYAVSPEVRTPHYNAAGEEVGMPVLTKVTLIVIVPVVIAILMMAADALIHDKSLSSISGLFFGVLAGTVLAYILGIVVDLVASVFVPAGVAISPEPERPGVAAVERAPAATRPADRRLAIVADREIADARQRTRPALIAMIKLLVGACSIYICVSFVMQTKDDYRFIIPYVEFSKQTKGQRPLVLDTSVIIDGRIADIADTRILESPMIIPRFVLEELQEIADSSDKLKRNRGRRGLDMLNRLRTNEKIDIRLTDARIGEVEEVAEVDHKLVAFAQHFDARIVTNDYNLNKVAQLRGVEVLNINDLANALKPVVLPGEALTVKIIKPGEETGQGVGYLDDGTMVVAEQGRDYIGREMPIVVTSTLQTSAGRMIFGRPEGAEPRSGGGRRRV
jgi:uncharacterized protein YacL